jgi:hypothetical protein
MPRVVLIVLLEWVRQVDCGRHFDLARTHVTEGCPCENGPILQGRLRLEGCSNEDGVKEVDHTRRW